MEGDGETVVAIIQALNDVGLAVTLMSGARLQNSQNQKSRKKVPITKSSVETSTEWTKRTSSAQICDDQYASSYQIAHCHLKPTSPSPYLSEFPAQRRAPSRTKGNFRHVGRFGCGETNSSEFKQQRFRGSYYHSPCHSPQSDSFVDSLRKYPLPTEKSVSTELIQRLINYTQTKHLSRNNCHSMRSLAPRPSRNSKYKKASKQASKATKNIQTYTRIVNEAPILKEKPKSKRSSRRNIDTRPSVDQLSETYNYLKQSSSGRRGYTGRCSEVRYFKDVKRYIRETIKRMVEAPAICPKIRSRYEEHRKQHHKQTDNITRPALNETEVNTDPITADTSTTIENETSCCLGTMPLCGICPKTLSRYRSHRKLHHAQETDENELNETEERQAETPTFCRAPPGTKHRRYFFPFGPWIRSHKDQATTDFKFGAGGETSDTDESSEGRRDSEDDIAPRVYAWLVQLSIYIDNTSEYQELYFEMAPELIDQLRALKGRDNHNDRAMKAITDFLDKLPVAAPEDLDEYEIDDPAEIREILAKWLDGINLDLKTKNNKIMSKETHLEKFVEDLEPIVHDNGTKEELKTEIMKMLPNPSQIALGSDTQDKISEHADNLVERLYGIILRKEKQAERAEQIAKNLNAKPIILDWLENNKDVPEDIIELNRNKAKKTDINLKKLASEHASDSVMAIEINKFLDTIAKEDIALTSEHKDELIKKIIHDVKAYAYVLNSMSPEEKYVLAQKLLHDIQPKNKSIESNQPVSDRLKNASNVSENTKKNKDLFKSFDNRLQQLKLINAANDIIDDEVKEFLESLPRKGISLTPSQHSQLAKYLINQTIPKPDRSKLASAKNQPATDSLRNASNISVDSGFSISRNVTSKPSERSKQTVTDWLENSPNIPEEIKNKIWNLTKHFDSKIKRLKYEGASDNIIEAEIKNFLNALYFQGIKMSPTEKAQLTRTILNEAKPVVGLARSDQPVMNWLVNTANIPEDTIRKNRSLVQNFDKKLKELQSKNVSDDIKEKEIKKFVNSLSENGISVSLEHKNQLLTDLLNNAKSEPKQRKRWDQNDTSKKAILSEVSSFIDGLTAVTNSKKKDIKRKIADLLASKINRLPDSEIKAEIEIILKNETDMPRRDVSNLASAIINRTKGTPLPGVDAYSQSPQDRQEKQEIIKNGIDSILNYYDISESAKKCVIDALADQILRGTSEDQTKRQLKFILKKANVKEEDAKLITDKLIRLRLRLDAIGFETSTPRGQEKEKLLPKRDLNVAATRYDTDTGASHVLGGEIDNNVSRRRPKSRMIGDSEGEEETDLKENDDGEAYLFPKDYKPPAKERKSRSSISKSSLAEMKYIQELIDIIKRWTYSTLPNLNDGDFIRIMTENIARNIVDTEKNIQQNSVFQSDEEEIDDLKNQISKWLNKFVDVENFPTKSEIKTLINEIRGVLGQGRGTPQLISGKEQPKISERHTKSPSKKSSIADIHSDRIQNYHDFVDETLKGAILDWLKEQQIYQDRSPSENRIQEKFASDLGDRLISTVDKTLSLNVDSVDPVLRKEIKEHLKKFPMDPELKRNQRFIDVLAQDLLDYLKVSQLLQDISQRFDASIVNERVYKQVNKLPLSRLGSPNKLHFEDSKEKLQGNIKKIGLGDGSNGASSDLKNVKDKDAKTKKADKFVEEAVERWVKNLNLPEPDDAQKNAISEAKADLITTLPSDVFYADNVPSNKDDETFQEATAQFLGKIPEHPYLTDDLDTLAKTLQEELNKISREYSPLSSESVKKKAADVLLDDIAKWVKNMPIESHTPEDEAEVEKIKQQLETKIVHKIGELNMNPEVFNDDFLYEDMLGDEVDNLVADIPSENVRNNQPQLKKELLDIVRKARQNIQEENAGLIYKQQLRETISRMLPPFNLSSEGKALFELLKDYIVDSFINMHYVGYDEQEINKLNHKIDDKIYKFCYDHLNRCPALPLDTKKLNEALYVALENITEPQNELFRNEVELVKLKDEISNWVKDLPLKMQTGQEKLQTSKMISVFVKKLHDIENMRQLIPEKEYDEKILKEIKTFLKKLPLTTDNYEDINQLAEILMKNLADTEELRKLNASTRHSIQPRSSCSCYIPTIPPSTLSKEDQDHLERIRKRTPVVMHRTSSKDASVSPYPVDASSQTEINGPSFDLCPVRNQCLAQRNSSAQTFSRIQAFGSQICESPKVVNDHYWDLMDVTCLQPPHVPCPFPPAPYPSCVTIPPPAPHPSCVTIPQQFRRPVTSGFRNPCIPGEPKPCLTNRPSTPHPSQMQFTNPRCQQTIPSGSHHQTRTPCKRSGGQRYRPAPCRPEHLLQNQSGIQCSVPDFSAIPHQLSDQSNISQQGNQFPQTASPHLRRQYSPASQQCSGHELPGQRNIRETPCNPCSGTGSQVFLRTRRPNQDNQPRTCMPSYSPVPSQGQSRPSTQNSFPFPPSQQMPCSRSPRPSYTRPEPISSEDYEARPSCSFQKRVTHLGSFDHMKPETCTPRCHDWDKFRINCHHWERDREPRDRNRHCVLSDEELHREGAKCRCKPKCGKYSERRKPCHLQNDETMNSCSRCCGVHCPYPSYLFFG